MRRHISNPSGNESYIDVPGDLDERTFAAMVERGEYTVLDNHPVPDSPFASRTRTTHNVVPGAEHVANERLSTGEPLPGSEFDTALEALTRGETLVEGAVAEKTDPEELVTTVREKLSHEPTSVLIADAGPAVDKPSTAKKAPAKKPAKT